MVLGDAFNMSNRYTKALDYLEGSEEMYSGCPFVVLLKKLSCYSGEYGVVSQNVSPKPFKWRQVEMSYETDIKGNIV